MPQPPITPKFLPWQHGRHILDPECHGTVSAFMIRGSNYSYQVNRPFDKSEWYYEQELELVPDQKGPIGFWPAAHSSEPTWSRAVDG